MARPSRPSVRFTALLETHDHQIGPGGTRPARCRAAGHLFEQGRNSGSPRCCPREIQEQRRAQPEHRLPEIFPARDEAATVLLHQLLVVVDEADRAEGGVTHQHQPDVAGWQVRPQQGRDGNGGEDQRAAHGRRAGLGQVRLRAVLTVTWPAFNAARRRIMPGPSSSDTPARSAWP